MYNPDMKPNVAPIKVCIIGTGYVGLVTGAVLADLGHDVECIDRNPDKVASLSRGICPIFEPGLNQLLTRNIKAQRLTFSTEAGKAVNSSEIVFICVGTPQAENGKADMTQYDAAIQGIISHLRQTTILVNKSTVPIGTAKRIQQLIQDVRGQAFTCPVVSNPEFLREGSAIYDAFYGDRIVIGSNSFTATMKMMDLYSGLNIAFLTCDETSAEMIKYASNCFLATKVSYINFISQLCEEFGANITAVAEGMGCDRRIGKDFLRAGIGFGGSCFGKDVSALAYMSEDVCVEPKLLMATLAINNDQLQRFVLRIEEVLNGLSGRQIAVWGLSFKPNTDDVRDSQAIKLVKMLIAKGAYVRVHDPEGMDNAAKELLADVVYYTGPMEAAEGADCVVLATDWSAYLNLDYTKLKNTLTHPIVFDGRGVLDQEELASYGLECHSIGRTMPEIVAA